MNTQQFFGDGMFGFMDDSRPDIMKSNATGLNQPMYNYNPNVNLANSKKRKHEEATTSSGLDQTLMPTALDTSVSEPGKGGFSNAPYSAGSNYMNTAVSDPAYSYGYGFNDDEFGLDMFRSSQSDDGQRSPAEYTNFVNDDLYSDQQFAF